MRLLKTVGIIAGLMFGAGIFALPFAVLRSGIFWGLLHMVVAALLMIFVLFLYAEITYSTEGRHRFIGYVSLILGKGYRKISLLFTLVIYYAVLLAYGVLGGVFLSNFFNGSYGTFFSILFFVFGSFLLCLRLDKLAAVNFYLTIPLFGFVLYLFVASFSHIDMQNFSWGLRGISFSDISWFVPYGVWLFSLSAFAAIPEARDIFFPAPLVKFKKVILVSVLLSVLFYCLFVFNIVGISGSQTSEDALAGLLGLINKELVLLGSLIGILAVFTSFLLMAADLRDAFRYDFGFSRHVAWFFMAAPPVVLFFLGIQDLAKIISLAGSLGMAFIGGLILLMSLKLQKKTGVILKILAMTAILIAVAYEIYSVLY